MTRGARRRARPCTSPATPMRHAGSSLGRRRRRPPRRAHPRDPPADVPCGRRVTDCPRSRRGGRLRGDRLDGLVGPGRGRREVLVLRALGCLGADRLPRDGRPPRRLDELVAKVGVAGLDGLLRPGLLRRAVGRGALDHRHRHPARPQRCSPPSEVYLDCGRPGLPRPPRHLPPTGVATTTRQAAFCRGHQKVMADAIARAPACPPRDLRRPTTPRPHRGAPSAERPIPLHRTAGFPGSRSCLACGERGSLGRGAPRPGPPHPTGTERVRRPLGCQSRLRGRPAGAQHPGST